MKVGLAAQVMSRRTAVTMRDYASSLTLDAQRTAEILEMFNDALDFLNSHSITDCGTRRPALRQLWTEQQLVIN